MKSPREYYLMHKDIPVCLMEISEEGSLSRVRRNSETARHFPLGGQMNNIAVMRNPDTLEFLGFAPIFDSGNSMFYNVPLEGLSQVKFSEIRTHSFIERECRLLQYVRDRSIVDLENAKKQDFSLYEQDISERHVRIPLLRDLYDRKITMLASFQAGKDIWKEDSTRYKKAITAH